MNLKEQIRQLQKERATELRTAHFQFARTRRDIRKNLSPKHFIRRHPDVAVAAAALAGVWLAPKLGHSPPAVSAASQRKGRFRHAITGFFTGLIPSLKHSAVTPEPSPAPREQAAHSHSLARTLLRTALPFAFRELLRQGFVQQWLDKAMHHGAARGQHNGHSPSEAQTETATDSGQPCTDPPLDPTAPE